MKTATLQISACPFCGGEAHLASNGDTPAVTAPEYRGKCETSGCPGSGKPQGWATAEEAVAAWNGRSEFCREAQPIPSTETQP